MLKIVPKNKEEKPEFIIPIHDPPFLGSEVVIDSSVPVGTVLFKDGKSGEVVGAITNCTVSQETNIPDPDMTMKEVVKSISDFKETIAKLEKMQPHRWRKIKKSDGLGIPLDDETWICSRCKQWTANMPLHFYTVCGVMKK